ncbi:MAG: hypothetical protein OXR66_06900 [Candidatus Woesearchaeota archaeon]|nr:hypothetical protein [Candidatus Woesearchaeota archaeon]
MNVIVVALVALVAIMSLVAMVVFSGAPTGVQHVQASAVVEENRAGDARVTSDKRTGKYVKCMEENSNYYSSFQDKKDAHETCKNKI